MSGDLFAQALIGIISVCGGIFLVVGARRRWVWLVDPPSHLWFCYSQSLLKAIFGSEGCRIITLNTGIALVCAGLFLIVRTVLL